MNIMRLVQAPDPEHRIVKLPLGQIYLLNIIFQLSWLGESNLDKSKSSQFILKGMKLSNVNKDQKHSLNMNKFQSH